MSAKSTSSSKRSGSSSTSSNSPVTFDGREVPDKLLCEAVWMTGEMRDPLKKAAWTQHVIQGYISVEGWEYIRERMQP